MSYGDEIMAAGCAQVLAEKIGKPVYIVDKNLKTRRHELWEGNPYIMQGNGKAPNSEYVVNGSCCRPYLKSITWQEGSQFTDWRVMDNLPNIFLKEDEIIWAIQELEKIHYSNKIILIEPNISQSGNKNKQWGFEKWQILADLIRNNTDYIPCQFIYDGAISLNNIAKIVCPDFRHACAVLNYSNISVLPEGGLHHACGALRKKAIVIFGGHTSPKTTGYDWHINIFPEDKKSPCGQWLPCDHCKKIMNSIEVNYIFEILNKILYN